MFQSTALTTVAARPLRVRRGAVATAAALAVAAVVGFGATPATAAAGRVPVEPVSLTVEQGTSPATVAALRAALEALPNSASVHVGAIVRNFAQGTLG